MSMRRLHIDHLSYLSRSAENINSSQSLHFIPFLAYVIAIGQRDRKRTRERDEVAVGPITVGSCQSNL